MTVLADHQIAAYAQPPRSLMNEPFNARAMITPFVNGQVRQVEVDGVTINEDERLMKHVVSYGLTSYGYDARLAQEFKVFTPIHRGGLQSVVDPKDVDDNAFTYLGVEPGQPLIIPPHAYVLGHTVETFDIPRNVIALCIGKSTYARCGLIVNVTPLEPGWRGQVTLELFNCLPLPMKVWPGEGICQFVFLQGDKSPQVSYADRQGKYMDQRGVVVART